MGVDAAEATGLKWLNAQFVRVYKSVNQSINNITWTTLTFDKESFDTNAMHDNVTNNSRLVAKVAGYYIIVGVIVYLSNATGLRYIQMRGNGGTFYAAPNIQIPAINGDTTTVVSLSFFQLAVNDYLELLAYQSSGGALNVMGGADPNGSWYTSFAMGLLSIV